MTDEEAARLKAGELIAAEWRSKCDALQAEVEALRGLVIDMAPYLRAVYPATGGAERYHVGMMIEAADHLSKAKVSDLRERLDADGWRDIASAPKDGDAPVLLYGRGVMQVGWYDDQLQRWGTLAMHATHWRPLPEPPKDAT